MQSSSLEVWGGLGAPFFLGFFGGGSRNISFWGSIVPRRAINICMGDFFLPLHSKLCLLQEDIVDRGQGGEGAEQGKERRMSSCCHARGELPTAQAKLKLFLVNLPAFFESFRSYFSEHSPTSSMEPQASLR